MKFFKKIKELTNLRKTIESEENKLNNLLDKKSKTDLEVKILEEKLVDREGTMQDIREVLESENKSKHDSIIEEAKIKAESIRKEASEELTTLLSSVEDYSNKKSNLEEELSSLQKEVNRYKNQARKFKSEIMGIKNFNKTYPNALNYDLEAIEVVIDEASSYLEKDGLLDTIIQLPIHSDNSKELKRLSNKTRKEIENILDTYKSRYTTKANRTIYQLMIIGLQAEMQLLLYKLTYQKLEETKDLVREIFQKYTIIVGKGNQSILSTLTRFITEIEPLYIELVDIEYRYYIKRQQEKEEQQAIKEQMKQEAEERKALEAERKKLEKEETKYKTEIHRNTELLNQETDESKILQLQKRLEELQHQLDDVENKKEEVTSLAMGKAGYVYVISNLGSFGANTFKIGMTRRLEPQQRVDELGSASVPFKFDVHSMIFSDDAVGLENSLHKRLSDSRINKVNFRKEFFKADINTLETIVEEIDPTAEFTRTMHAEEYQQTLALEESLNSITV